MNFFNRELEEVNNLLGELQRHKLLPLAKIFFNDLRPIEREEILEDLKRWALKSLVLSNEIAFISKRFRKVSIQPLFFKGPVLAKLLYNDVSERYYSDLDLLIDEQEFIKSIGILKGLGYSMFFPNKNLSEIEWRNFFKVKNDIGLFHPEKRIYLELHVGIFDDVILKREEEKQIISETKKIQFFGNEITTLRNEENFIYLCFHGSKHGFFRLSWLRDVAVFIEQVEVDHQIVVDKIRLLGFERLFGLSLILAINYFEVSVPESYKPFIRQDWRMRLSVRFCETFIQGPESNKIRKILKPKNLFKRDKGYEDPSLKVWISRHLFGLLREPGLKYKIDHYSALIRKRRITNKYLGGH